MRSQENRSTKRPGRKRPTTIPAIAGMLESSAHLDQLAAKRRIIEAEKFGRPTGQTMNWHGKDYEVADITGGYSLGITISAQILAGQAAELALKYAYESENLNVSAPARHELDFLYSKLSQDKKVKTEEVYKARVQQQEASPGEGWKTAEQAFQSGKDYPVLFRYLTEEGASGSSMEPIFLREAVCSVLASIGTNIRWGSS